jgi:hypothetical protein
VREHVADERDARRSIESTTSRRRALVRSASQPPASDESTPAALAAPRHDRDLVRRETDDEREVEHRDGEEDPAPTR